MLLRSSAFVRNYEAEPKPLEPNAEQCLIQASNNGVGSMRRSERIPAPQHHIYAKQKQKTWLCTSMQNEGNDTNEAHGMSPMPQTYLPRQSKSSSAFDDAHGL